MRKRLDIQKLKRIVDANYNRSKEGLRVCEDVARFWLDNGSLSARWKKIRHELSKIISLFGLEDIIEARDIRGDVGRTTVKTESSRRDVKDIFYANGQRVKESLRVLEEFAKLGNIPAAERLKRLRYAVYDAEKETLGVL